MVSISAPGPVPHSKQTFLPAVPVVVKDLHFKGSGSLSYFIPDSAHPDDSKSRPGNFNSQPVSSETICVWRNCNLGA